MGQWDWLAKYQGDVAALQADYVAAGGVVTLPEAPAPVQPEEPPAPVPEAQPPDVDVDKYDGTLPPGAISQPAVPPSESSAPGGQWAWLDKYKGDPDALVADYMGHFHELDTGEFVRKDWYDELPDDQKRNINKVGVEVYSKHVDVAIKQQEEKQAKFLEDTIAHPETGERFDKAMMLDSYGVMNPYDETIRDVDWGKFHEDQARMDTLQRFSEGARVGDIYLAKYADMTSEQRTDDPGYQGYRDAADYFYSLDDEGRQALQAGGVEGLAEYETAKQMKYDLAMKFLNENGYIDEDGNANIYQLAIDAEKGAANHDAVRVVLDSAGYDPETIDGAIEYAGRMPESKWSQVWQGMTPWDEMRGDTVSASGSLKMAGNLVTDVMPVVGTVKHWDKMGGWEKFGNVALDMLSIVPAVAVASAAAKTGAGPTRAIATGIASDIRATATAPYYVVKYPIASARTLVAPAEIIFSKNRQPLASFWRGTYHPEAGMTKVPAGVTEAEALATRQAMEDMLGHVVSGEKAAGTEPIGDIGKIRYSSTGLQEIIPDTVVTATPYGPVFKAKGVVAGDEGLFVAGEAYLDFAHSTATGQAPQYVFKGKNLLGYIDDTGKALDEHGRVLGTIGKGTKVLSPTGKTLGTVDAMGQVVDKGKILAKMRGTTAVTENPEVIAKIAKDLGVDIPAGKEQTVGVITEGASIVNEAGKTIGKTKAQPSFVLIHTRGVQPLSEATRNAKSMGELEDMAWEAWRTGGASYTEDLFPVYKQYTHWIENEGFLPPGAHLVPVVDKKGKPVMMWTRGIGGERIEVPAMQLVDKTWFEKALKATQDLAAQPLHEQLKAMPVGKALGHVKDLPKSSAGAVLGWLRANPQAKVFGSFSEYVYTGKRRPGDVDIAHPDPLSVIDGLADVVRKSTKSQVRVGKSLKHNSATIEVMSKGVWKEAIDLQPMSRIAATEPGFGLPGFRTSVVDGVSIQTPQSQLGRVFKRLQDEFGRKGAARFPSFIKALGGDIDLGMGAKAPTYGQVLRLKARGMYNTVRDIFVPALGKNVRVQAAADVAPDQAADVARMIDMEEGLLEAQDAYRRMAMRQAVEGTRAPGAARGAKGTMAARDMDTPEARQKLAEIDSRQRELTSLRDSLTDRIYTRAVALERVISEVPTARPGPDGYRDYEKAVTKRYGSRDAIATEREIGRVVRRGEDQARRDRPARVAEVDTGRGPRVPRELERERPARARVPERGRPTRTPRMPERPTRITGRRRVDVRRERARTPDKRVRVGLRPTRVKPVIPAPGPGGERQLVTGRPGTVAWRQGFVWWSLSPPYRQEDLSVSRKPPTGAVVAMGVDSAYDTIQGLGGAVPPEPVTVDMGIMDVEIEKVGVAGKQGAIEYQRDPKSTTISKIDTKGVVLRSKKKRTKKGRRSAKRRGTGTPIGDSMVRELRL